MTLLFGEAPLWSAFLRVFKIAWVDRSDKIVRLSIELSLDFEISYLEPVEKYGSYILDGEKTASEKQYINLFLSY